MGQNTKIEWTHRQRADGSYIPGHTFNPWIGCEHKVDPETGEPHPGCEHCYAEAFTNYTGKAQWGTLEQGGTRTKTSPSYWRQPLKWNAEAERTRERQIVFCASFADVFEDWQGPIQTTVNKQPVILAKNDRASDGRDRMTMDDLRGELFKLIDATPWLDWLLLTKRPENIRRMWPANEDSEACFHNYHRENVWLVTSISDQATWDTLWPHLAECRELTPVLGISAEPLLGEITMRAWCPRCKQLLDGSMSGACGECLIPSIRPDQVIAGGESGPKSRFMHPRLPRSLRDQCQAAGVAFFFKQWGEFSYHEGLAGPVEGTVRWEPSIPASAFAGQRLYAWTPDVNQFQRPSPDALVSQVMTAGALLAAKVGKEEAGRLLDGREWREFPREAKEELFLATDDLSDLTQRCRDAEAQSS